MNKVWLVTGSASGLGRNIAEALLESGDRLVATARDTKRLDDLVKKYGDRVRAVPLDVTDERHLLIGSDAVRFAAEAEKTRAAEGAQWRDVSLSTDTASATALPAMRF
jgi:NADP-dependent 3-hydroxy acid dehydrogenase YdfG